MRINDLRVRAPHTQQRIDTGAETYQPNKDFDRQHLSSLPLLFHPASSRDAYPKRLKPPCRGAQFPLPSREIIKIRSLRLSFFILLAWDLRPDEQRIYSFFTQMRILML
jgi:hypothetical protein